MSSAYRLRPNDRVESSEFGLIIRLGAKGTEVESQPKPKVEAKPKAKPKKQEAS